MSAWGVFSAMGFYPATPASGYYVLGLPRFQNVRLTFENGKQFEVIAKNLSDQNCYVQSVKLNGKKVDWKYVGKDLALVVTLPERPAGAELVLECQFPARDTEILRGKKAFFHRMMAYTPVLKDVFNTSVDPYKLLSRPFLKLAQCASHIEADPEGMLQYLQNIDIEAVKTDLEQEAAAVEAEHPDRAARIRVALNVILSQVNL